MATLIPSIGTCVARMTPGERLLVERIEQKLGDYYNPSADEIQIMTMKVSKGLEFPVEALPGVGHLPAKGGRAGGWSSVLCGCDCCYAAVSDCGSWGW